MQKGKILTPIGEMWALADSDGLYLLAFEGQKVLAKSAFFSEVKEEDNSVLEQIRGEIKRYFEGTLREFRTPYQIRGTSFQRRVWQELAHIPYGERRSYKNMAKRVGSGARAVALAHAANPLTLLLPCHRVVRESGELSGYAGGVERKKWLLEHEVTKA